MTTRWFARTRALNLQLVRRPSITDTDGETAFAHKLHALIAQHPYFRLHRDRGGARVDIAIALSASARAGCGARAR
jgi:arginine utilization protein RocB